MTRWDTLTPETCKPVTRKNVCKTPQWASLDQHLRRAVTVVSAVLPFRTNRYVMDELIDWGAVPDDPMYQLTFPQEGMLDRPDFEILAGLIEKGAGEEEIRARATAIRQRMNPHPSGQAEHNVPTIEGRRLPGIQPMGVDLCPRSSCP